MTRNVTKALLGSTLLAVSGHAASISTSVNTDAGDLANNVLGSGVSIQGTPTLQSSTNSAGTFTGGNASGLGIDQGIVLSSGSVSDIDNTNSSDSTSTTTNSGTDAELDTLVPQSVQDATTLSLDFTTSTGDVFFNYAFASEEYNEFVSSNFNDPFGLFLDGENIAIAPNGDSVSINNVNCGGDGASSGPNCSSFNNNDPSNTSTPFNFEFDGFTDIFTAQATGLAPGLHTLKFAVGDAGDSSLDSAVFIQGGSLGGENPSEVPAPLSILLMGSGLLGLGLARRKGHTRQ